MMPGGVVVVDVGSVLFVEPVVVLDVTVSVGTLVLTSSASGDMMKGGWKINVKVFKTSLLISPPSDMPPAPSLISTIIILPILSATAPV